jgi:hypothetical protein
VCGVRGEEGKGGEDREEGEGSEDGEDGEDGEEGEDAGSLSSGKLSGLLEVSESGEKTLLGGFAVSSVSSFLEARTRYCLHGLFVVCGNISMFYQPRELELYFKIAARTRGTGLWGVTLPPDQSSAAPVGGNTGRFAQACRC